jgi:hypothetical protein
MFKFLKVIPLLILSTSLFADNDIQMDGTIEQSLPNQPQKIIQLMKFKLSQDAENLLVNRSKIANQLNFQALALKSDGLGHAVQLGMGNTPVLDQGAHGTCVTFATTAALDALLNKGDYISQLCTLTLNQYLSNRSYTINSWGGNRPLQLFQQLKMFGIINKDNQRQYGCGGINEYSLEPGDPSNEMDIDSYHQLSENLDFMIDYDTTQLLDVFQFFKKETSMVKIQQDVKEALKNGDRLTIGTLLVPDNFLGAQGKFHNTADSWVLTPEIAAYLRSSKVLAGHAMIITGFDDNATAYDAQGREHKGLFTLRNSWGMDAGDKGNYYMSYDYFQSMAIDLVRLRKL